MKFQIQDFIINNVDYGVNYRLKFTVPGIAYFLIYLKETEKGVSAMCDAVKDLVDEFVEDEKKEIAKKLLKINMPVAQIADITGLPTEQVRQLSEMNLTTA